MNTLLLNAPLILATLLAGFGTVLIVHDARRQAKKSEKHLKSDVRKLN
jgi:hypothetical protein